MKIDVTDVPKEARLFIISNNVEMCMDNAVFYGQVYQHNDDTEYNTGVTVRCRLYGMSPFEFTGTKEQVKELVVDGVLKVTAYRDILAPNIKPELPYFAPAKKIMDESILAQEDKEK